MAEISRRAFVGGASTAALAAAWTMTGCSGGSSGGGSSSAAASGSAEAAGERVTKAGVDLTDWEAVKEAAKGTEVRALFWGGDANFNKWMSGTVADYMKEHYDIKFVYDTVTNTAEAVTVVSDEKQAGSGEGEGTVDMLWLDSENFRTAKQGGLLYGKIVDLVPNAEKYLDKSSPFYTVDNGTPTDGFEVPWDPGVDVIVANLAVTPKQKKAPTTADEFKKWIMDNPGKITYPTADDTFGRRSIYMFTALVCGGDWHSGFDENTTKEEVKAAMQPALDWMAEVNPYLWQEGKNYPQSSDEWMKMFANEEVANCFDWSAYGTAAKIKEGTYPKTAHDVFLDFGTLAGMGYLNIAFDAPNVPGALCVIDGLLSPELQYGMVRDTGYGNAISYDLLSDEEKKLADSIDVGEGSYSAKEIDQVVKWPEPPSYTFDFINELWWEEVAGK